MYTQSPETVLFSKPIFDRHFDNTDLGNLGKGLQNCHVLVHFLCHIMDPGIRDNRPVGRRARM